MLVAHFFGEYRCANSPDEMEELLAAFLAGPPDRTALAGDCETAFFGFTPHQLPEGIDLEDWEHYPDNSLLVTINYGNGYGAFYWCVKASRGAQINAKLGSDMADWPWVSDAGEGIGFDPKLLVDPEGPFYHDPRNALPGSEVRSVLEEFLRTANGDRPETISWAKGQDSGERI
jgi:hypothetical protein